MGEELNDSITKITKTVFNFVTQFHETEDEFIFETISPFCIDILRRMISKKELKEMLLRAEQITC